MPLLCTYSLEIHFYMQSGKFMQSGSKNRHKMVPIRGEQKAKKRSLQTISKTEMEEEVPFQMVIIRLIIISSYTEK